MGTQYVKDEGDVTVWFQSVQEANVFKDVEWAEIKSLHDEIFLVLKRSCGKFNIFPTSYIREIVVDVDKFRPLVVPEKTKRINKSDHVEEKVEDPPGARQFVKGALFKCPQCGATKGYYRKKKNNFRCILCQHEWE
jgi:hypothetical protein